VAAFNVTGAALTAFTVGALNPIGAPISFIAETLAWGSKEVLDTTGVYWGSIELLGTTCAAPN